MSQTTVRILVIDDDYGDIAMTTAMISQIDDSEVDYQVESVTSFEEALDAFQSNAYDVYLVDYFLEDRDGLDLVRQARSLGLRKPLIMLTGRGNRRVDVEAMEAGASDYLVKGRVDPELAERTIRWALRHARAEARVRESERRHRELLAHLPVPVYRIGPDGGVVDANPALLELLGYPDGDRLESDYAANLFVAPDDRERFRALLDGDGAVRRFETSLALPDGRDVRVVNTARLHRAPDGTVAYVEGTLEPGSPVG